MRYSRILSCIPAAALLCSCGVAVGNNNFSISLKYEKQAEVGNKPDMEKGTDSFVYSFDAGSCKINGGAETAEVSSSVTVKGDTQEMDDKIADSLYFFTETKETAMHLTLCSGLSEGLDVWSFIRNGEYKDKASVSADTVLSLPESITCCEIEDGAGNIEINGFSGQAKIVTGAGAVDVKDSVLSGATEIDTGAGSISIDLAGAPAMGSMLDISTGVGEITFTLPGSLNEDTVIELNTGVGSITLDTAGHEYTVEKDEGAVLAHETEISIDGKCKIRMSTGTGDITINEPSALEE